MLGATTWWEVTSVSAEKDMPSMKTRNAYVSDYWPRTITLGHAVYCIQILILHLQLCATHLAKTEGHVLVQAIAVVYLATRVRNLGESTLMCYD